MYSISKKKYERKLYMADKSKNEQYDIVAQAEDVLRLYAKRYFELSRKRKRLPKRASRMHKGTIFALLAICLVFGAVLTAILYFI